MSLHLIPEYNRTFLYISNHRRVYCFERHIGSAVKSKVIFVKAVFSLQCFFANFVIFSSISTNHMTLCLLYQNKVKRKKNNSVLHIFWTLCDIYYWIFLFFPYRFRSYFNVFVAKSVLNALSTVLLLSLGVFTSTF